MNDLPNGNGILGVSESSDLKDSFKELNDDSIDKDGFTAIDMRTRLTHTQIPSLVGLDILSIGGVYPRAFGRIGRSVKRLSVSIKGHGRKEMVDIVKGVKEQEATAGKSIIERSRE